MSKYNFINDRKDIWGAQYCEGASFTDNDVPACPTTAKEIPTRIITWTQAQTSKDYDAWVSFMDESQDYTDIWNKPIKTLNKLAKFAGVIAPSFLPSTDVSTPVFEYATYQAKSYSYWLGNNNIQLINNPVWTNQSSVEIALSGLDSNSIMAITNKYYDRKNYQNRIDFEYGLSTMIEEISPSTLIVYGKDDPYFRQIRKQGINVIIYDGESGLQTNPIYCVSFNKPTSYPTFKEDIIPGKGTEMYSFGMKSSELQDIIDYQGSVFIDSYTWYSFTIENKIRIIFKKSNDCIAYVAFLKGYEGKMNGIDIMHMKKQDFQEIWPNKLEYDDLYEVYVCKKDKFNIEYDFDASPAYLRLSQYEDLSI